MANYDFVSKLLHMLTLGNPWVGELCFDIELSLKRKELFPSINEQHVFVSGLARAGTTILMRGLYDTGQFASLTYRDMPFVLAPNFWSKVTEHSQRNMTAEVRAHDDGILVDFDSPEAFEEVFWRTFVGNSYIKKDKLLPHVVDSETINKFRDYVSLILLRYERSRYLSKNNNNILRLDSIRTAFPKATVLVPFRDPLQHAYSLMQQHHKFIAKNVNDPFIDKYMGWLVHHEFGCDHRPFKWKEHHNLSIDIETIDIETIDYWLSHWVATYSEMFKQFDVNSESLLFVCYESMCSDTERVWGALLDRLKINSKLVPDLNLHRLEVPLPRITGLEKKAVEIYQELKRRSPL